MCSMFDLCITDRMEDWDEQKLEEVVAKKHSESDKAKLKTSIVCIHHALKLPFCSQ